MQYRDSEGELRLLIELAGADMLVDVTASVVSGGGDLVAAIARARREKRSTHDLLTDVANDGTSPRYNLAELRHSASSHGLALDVPVTAPEIWAAGVSYRRSREARELESDANEIYANVYAAERPELFMKDSGCRRTVGAGQPIHVRPDSNWNVPEPELALVLDAGGAIVGYTIGNDVSSRQIEAENPLYLPQAKIYANACSLGPAVLLNGGQGDVAFDLRLRILDGAGRLLYEGATSTREMKRSFPELVSYLTRFNPIADGTVLLTGTGIVPHDEFTLSEGHIVEIEVPGIGILRNPVTWAPNGLQEQQEAKGSQ